MYNLYLVTTHQSWYWYSSFLTNLNLTVDDHQQWKKREQNCPLVKQASESFDNSIIDGKFLCVCTEIWSFDNKEDLMNFYNNYTSDDSELNLNRPYAWKDGAVAVKNAGAEFKFYIKNKDNTEELLYNNSDYLVAV